MSSYYDDVESSKMADNIRKSQHLEKLEVKYIDDPDELKLKKNVFLSFTDTCAGGSRALLGIDMRLEYFKMDIAELTGHQAACVRDRPPQIFEQDFLPFQVLNCKYEEFSIVVVNTHLRGNECHYVANRVMELCVQSQVEHITLLAVLKLDLHGRKLDAIYENLFYSTKGTKLNSLPSNVMLEDPFFSTFMQMVHVEKIPTHTLIIPGFRGYKGQANTDDSSKQSIALFQKIINKATGLTFDNDLSNRLVYSGPADDKSDLVAMIYG